MLGLVAWPTSVAWLPPAASAQTPPDRVLVRSLDRGPDGRLPVDRGASGVWQRLQKLTTTGSVLYTAGHPDDEEAGVLTLLGRGMGVRTALLTVNRGEGGANAVGPELFDALGLIRTEELRHAGRYYGLDDQYFTTAVDYGYSKTLDEAMRSWDREAVLGDMVRIIRLNRPLVVISRWHGSERDGHGHHQAAGVLTPEAVAAAADPSRFSEQITNEGLRPWRVRLVYRGRVLPGETHHAELDPYLFSSWLGESFQAFGSYGLSLQRSQTSGRRRIVQGPGAPARYERLSPAGTPTPPGGGPPGSPTAGSDMPARIFGDLDTSLSGLATLFDEPVPEEAANAMRAAAASVERATLEFRAHVTHQIVYLLLRTLGDVREARSLLAEAPETDFALAIKERQIVDALAAAAGSTITAYATPAGSPPGTPMGAAVPGQRLDLHVTASIGGGARLRGIEVRAPRGWQAIRRSAPEPSPPATPTERPGPPVAATFDVTVAPDAPPTRSWFHRPDIRRNEYLVRDSSELHLGESRPPVHVVATFEAGRHTFEVVTEVRTLVNDAPWGTLERPLEVVPALAVRATPATVIAPGDGRFTLGAEVTSNAPDAEDATVMLDLPQGWTASPSEHAVSFSGPGQTAAVSFDVRLNDTPDRPVPVRVQARSSGRTYTDGYRLIEHRDLRPQRLYEPAKVMVHPVRVAIASGLRTGYVMGVGDDVPDAIEQLGASVELLDADDLAAAPLGAFDAIVVGTRAYAVRPDLVAANDRLLDYARSGGNLVVLYQTPEYDPERQAPWPASLPGNAEEVSEEDAPVTVLAPAHPLLTTPNRLEPGDFDGWIEQRGSKFFTTWSAEYTPLVETHDTGQPPQRGVWLTARVGEGHFTYVALALQRQVPYGVPGAYRILANLLSLGR